MTDEVKHSEKKKTPESGKNGSPRKDDGAAAQEGSSAADGSSERRRETGKNDGADRPPKREAPEQASAPGKTEPRDSGKEPSSEGGNDGKEAEHPPAAKRAKAKAVRHVPAGIAHINATFNNTIVTISDRKGAVIAWSSAGRLGFAGTKKSSAYAATMVAQDAARQAAVCRLQEVEVRVQGPGAGRESAIRALQSAGLTISAIRDVTPIPHNGCRPRKRRRV